MAQRVTVALEDDLDGGPRRKPYGLVSALPSMRLT